MSKRLRHRLADLLVRALQRFRVAIYRALSGLRTEGAPVLNQPMLATGRGLLRFDGKVTIGVFPSPFFLSGHAYIEARGPHAMISIGDGTSINNEFTAIAEHTSITIGQRVLIGTRVEIIDSDFHGLAIDQRFTSNPEWARPVTIADDVFIGSNARITKGVSIGTGAVVANGAVVHQDVPAHAVVAGNPARVLRYLVAEPG